MHRVFVTGGSGFVGRALCAALRARGDEVVVLSRDAASARARLSEVDDGVEFIDGDPTVAGAWQQSLTGCTAVVNLAGQSVASHRWTAHYKQLIHDSRVEGTRYLVEGLAACPAEHRPGVLVSASGIDYYPFSVDLGASVTDWDDDDEIDERAPSSDSFLGRVCRNWETEARAATASDVRVVLLRIGLVLGPGGGVVDKMAAPFKWFLGGRMGKGKQWMSWVHLEDLLGAILFAIDRDSVSGPMNLVSPSPVRNRVFARLLGKALGRPSWLPVPAFAVRAAVGEEFAEHLLHGRRAVPRALLEAGYEFRYPELGSAFAAIF